MKQTPIRRGDVFWVNYDPSQETEIQKTRPSVIISHDMMNDKFTRVIVAPITSNVKKVYAFDHKLYDHPKVMGKVLLHQLRTVDKSRVGDKICSLSIKEMHEIDLIIKFLLGLD